MTDIPIKEFLLEEISSRLGEPILLNKTDFPLIAICRSSRTAHSSVIFLPPEGHYFAAAGIKYPGIFKGVDEYTRENLVPSDLIYKSFIAWMKEAGIRKDFVPSDLFSPYASWGCYGESGYFAMGKRARTLEWDQKLFSAFVGNEWVEPVINYFNEQQKQFGKKRLSWVRHQCISGGAKTFLMTHGGWLLMPIADQCFQIYPKNKRSMMSFNWLFSISRKRKEFA